MRRAGKDEERVEGVYSLFAQRSTQSENALAHRFLCARYVGPGRVVAKPMEEEKKDGVWTQWGLAD